MMLRCVCCTTLLISNITPLFLKSQPPSENLQLSQASKLRLPMSQTLTRIPHMSIFWLPTTFNLQASSWHFRILSGCLAHVCIAYCEYWASALPVCGQIICILWQLHLHCECASIDVFDWWFVCRFGFVFQDLDSLRTAIQICLRRWVSDTECPSLQPHTGSILSKL